MDQLTKASSSSSPKSPEFTFYDVNHYISSFPPGFRFVPTNKELVKFYLEKKLKNQILPPNQMVVADIYDSNPETLCNQYKNLGNDEWYFFSPRTRKYPKGNRPKRSTQDGYWKVSGTEKIVKDEEKLVARWNTLVFYEGSAPDGKKTNWIMREYRLVDSSHERISVEDMTLDDYVLCRLYKKPENTNTDNDTDNDSDNDKKKAENTNTNNDTKKQSARSGEKKRKMTREIEDFVEQKKPKHDDDCGIESAQSSLLTFPDSHFRSYPTNMYITTPTTFEDSSNCSLNYKTIPKEESYFDQQDHLACHNTNNNRRILEDFQLQGPTFYDNVGDFTLNLKPYTLNHKPKRLFRD